jgi:hypothetical protein
MDMKILSAVAFLFAMQMIPFFAFHHYQPAQSIAQMNKNTDSTSNGQIADDSINKEKTERSNIERF